LDHIDFAVKHRSVNTASISGLPVIAGVSGTLNWDDVLGGSRYRVLVSLIGTESQVGASSPVVDRLVSRSDVALTIAAGRYQVTLQVVGVPASTSSSVLARTFTVQPLAKVTGVTTTGLSANRVAGSITWQPVPGATRYELALTDETRSVTRTLRSSGTSYSIVNGLAFGRYRLQVRALNGTADGAWSNAKVITVKLSPVTNLRTSPVIVGTPFRGVWGAVSGASAGYDVWVYNTVTKLYVLKTNVSGTSFTGPANLRAGVYRILVRASHSEIGPSAWSVVILTVRPLARVSGVTVSGLSRAGQAGMIAWNAVVGASSYQVQITKAGSLLTVVSPTTGALSRTVLLYMTSQGGSGEQVSLQGAVDGYRLSLAADEFVLIRQWLADGSSTDWVRLQA